MGVVDTTRIQVFDTLGRRKVPLTLRESGAVSMYVCGPTVYDAPHVGHGRMTVVFDVIRRYLEWSGLEVLFVSNVTDIDDKIIARAAESSDAMAAVAQRYESVWWHEMGRLGVRRPDETPHATAYVEEMIRLIGELVAMGHAYAVPDRGVYFDVATFPGYGELPHRALEQLMDSAGARIEVDDAKHSSVDFALWKAVKPGEPSWESPWGRGRPGWHIECSAMALDLLGDGFDLHGGGKDLVFPHHENERAQAEAAGHRFATHWLHSGLVEVAGQKMSKSIGNFTTLADALDAHGPRAFRLAVLQVHYRSDMDLGDTELADAGSGMDRLDALTRRAAGAGVELADAPLDDGVVVRFRAEMDDDFGTPQAVAAIFEAATAANKAIDQGDGPRAASLLRTVDELARVLGLTIDPGTGEDDEIQTLVGQRDDARANRDFARADAIRDELGARGIALEDTPHGTIWHRE